MRISDWSSDVCSSDLLALAASEERLRLAQELGGVGSFDWDNVRDESEVSDVLRQILGLPPDLRVSRQSHATIIYPDDLATFDAAIDAAIAGSKDFDVEYRDRKSGVWGKGVSVR